MKIAIDDDVLKKHNLTLGEFLALLINAKNIKIAECEKSVVQKNLADWNIFDGEGLILSNQTKSLLSTIVLESSDSVQKAEKSIDFMALADKLREIYPEGSKKVKDKSYSWRDNTTVIAKRLQTVIDKFNFTFTEEQAIDATKRYVESFKDDTTFMQTLKYFIWKNEKTGDGYNDLRSEFMTKIQNRNDKEQDTSDWLTELR